MNYNDFIRQINSLEIKSICFKIRGYAHYKRCKIYRKSDEIRENRYVQSIVCQLTEDNYETVSFYKTFNETYKLFNFGKKGKFTLKQIWHLVEIIELN